MRDWREQQLSWFKDAAVIKQDYDLLQTINRLNPRGILFKGDTEYFQSSVKHNNGPYDFCIYIVNHSFNFDSLIYDINDTIAELENDSTLYLSINKYLAEAKVYDVNLPEEYDQAIEQYVSSRINAKLEKYYSAITDNGRMFNFVHPLTRFYFKISK